MRLESGQREYIPGAEHGQKRMPAQGRSGGAGDIDVVLPVVIIVMLPVQDRCEVSRLVPDVGLAKLSQLI